VAYVRPVRTGVGCGPASGATAVQIVHAIPSTSARRTTVPSWNCCR